MANSDGKRPPRAFEEIVAEYLDPLYRAAVLLTGGRADEAEDLLQDAMVQGLRHWQALREPASARAWLFRILTRTHFNRRRTVARRRELSEEDAGDEVLADETLAEWRARFTPGELAGARVRLEQLEQAAEQLPETWRAVFLLVDVEGFGHREVAAILEIPEGTVASRLYRARQRLGEQLLADPRWRKWR